MSDSVDGARPVLVYWGPEEGAEVVREVAGRELDVRVTAAERDAVAEALRGAAAFLDASMKVRLDAPMLAAAPHLRLAATATTGSDHIDHAVLTERGIPLLTLRGQSDLLRVLTPAAVHSWLLLLGCARRLAGAREHVLAGGWDRTQFPGLMLRGRTLGIVGCGRIGSWMARYAGAFGMACLGYDPHLADFPESIRPAQLDELLSSSDAVTVHVHLTDETRGLLGREQIERLKRGCILVNTSRGEVVDERALLDALRSGRLGAAGLDVLAGEPEIDDHPLRGYALEHDNLLITPHIGGYSPDAVRTVVRFSAERILDHLGLPR